ncbi:glycoside hydrolase family 97 protein [Paraflavitalea sp. CAU 1676]|uniref:glycoside hydrolase family 97 protein n=1 Tax=Paraflavitalea sp. CAU 1676 TaxID=3032598 RepID=UPI0023DAF63F|nr:glycoside hydrolase family 97 protein [Paraflavitalea sp. CAU 1676]MDF2193754.1 glycoside hydrolase family 97 catalytic domain-containing protein [Paraflavitalea sp. CAU 1676]
MRYFKRIIAVLCLLHTLHSQAQVRTIVTLSSPDKQTACLIGHGPQGELRYKITYGKKTILDWSVLGLVVNDTYLLENIQVNSGALKLVKESFAWPLGEDDHIDNHYWEITLHCRPQGTSFNIIIRAYNGSIAFRYELPRNEQGTIQAELTTFELPATSTLYQYNHESVFTPTALDTFSNTCDLPATLTNAQGYLSIGEADNIHYTKAELKKGKNPNSLAITFARDKVVTFAGAYRTPWRTISCSEKAIGLHTFSQLYLKLASNPVREVPAWIKPGKLIRAQLTTQAGLDCIDFAAKHHFQYIMFDAGWYGAEFRSSSDPTQVIPAIDMPKVISYGKEKGIGVILYVNYVGLQAKLDTILPLYKQWGVAGLKFGFVDGLTQKGLSWLSQAIPKVYNHGFILNIHDNYKPTGLSRTWPSLLTQEGIRGDENSPDAFHNTVLPFTRFLAGPADFTFCYPNTTNSYSKNIKVSMAQQLALTVVNFSPLQSMLWYGKPTEYTNEEEIEFFAFVPTVWNESHYLAGEIGKNISVARRHGNTWFVGNVAGPEAFNGSLHFDFLTKKKTYTATIYEDDGNGSIRKRTLPVKRGDRMPFSIAAKGGQAMIIR